ncbi:MBL fold metallo-hydrolase [Rhodoferax sediminis]|jgi:hypothetical protein|uniref:MBL fold metallo-hydrolase n=1 Tax=Rhodoferax sediminis TaxID=2509614 RepID=UPI001AEF6A06|nr:MBL fold metallo-hydrolase [Rhodoferax sediminis]
MKSLGKKPDGRRLDRVKSSLLWAGDGFRNMHPVLPGLRNLEVPRPTLSEFLYGGTRRVPRGPLPVGRSAGRLAAPARLAGPRRSQPVPIALRELPPIDLVLVSHDHYDHLDYPTIRELARREVPFVTSLGVGAHLEAWGVPAQRITELD